MSFTCETMGHPPVIHVTLTITDHLINDVVESLKQRFEQQIVTCSHLWSGYDDLEDQKYISMIVVIEQAIMDDVSRHLKTLGFRQQT